MNRKFTANIIFLIALNVIIKPFWFFGIEITVQNRLGNIAYGLYASLLSFSILFNFLLDLGITNFNNREIARNRILLEKYFSHIIGIKILLGLLYAFICLFIGFWVGFKGKSFFLLIFLVFNQFLSSLILYLRSNVNALLMFVTDSLLSVMDKALMIVMLALLLWANVIPIQLSVEVFVLTQTIAYLLTAITAGWIVRRHCKYFHPVIDLRHIAVIVRKSLPFTLLVMLMGMYNRMEPVLLQRMLPNGSEQAGLYAQGFRILEVLSNFALLFSVLLLPLFSRMIKANENIVPLLRTATTMLLIPAVALTFNVFFFRNEWVELLYHNPARGNVFGTIIMGFPGICMTYIFGTLLTANGSFRQLNLMAFSMVVIDLTLNFLLIPRWYAQGSAWASFITQTLAGVVQVIMVAKIFKIQIFTWWRTIRLGLWLILTLGICVLIKHMDIHWLYAFGASLGVSLAGAVVLKLLPVFDWLRLMFPAYNTLIKRNGV